MRIRFHDDHIREVLRRRSAVNKATLLIEGVHCREWRRAKHNLGYGKLWDGERPQFTHRLSWEVNEGPIPTGLRVLHRCDNPACIEIRHLKVGTAKDNSEDMVRKGRHLAGAIARGIARTGQPNYHLRGEGSPRSKLTLDEARAIKGLRGNLNVRATDVGRKYGISESSVRAIWRGTLWGWLGVEPNQDVGRISPLGLVKPPKPEKPRKYEIGDPLRPTVKKLSLRAVLKGIAA